MRSLPLIIGLLGFALACQQTDEGGQEGEERGGWLSDHNDAAATDSAQSGSGGESDTGLDPDDLGPVLSEATQWSGTLVAEQGRGAEGERDCVVSWTMTGTVSPLDCEGCVAVFDVVHVIDEASTVGATDCPDLPGDFAATYAVLYEGGDTAELQRGDGMGGFVPYATAEVGDGRLDWSIGTADVPESDGDDTVYVTDLQQGRATLD